MQNTLKASHFYWFCFPTLENITDVHFNFYFVSTFVVLTKLRNAYHPGEGKGYVSLNPDSHLPDKFWSE